MVTKCAPLWMVLLWTNNRLGDDDFVYMLMTDPRTPEDILEILSKAEKESNQDGYIDDMYWTAVALDRLACAVSGLSSSE